jgi:hypothetical protein
MRPRSRCARRARAAAATTNDSWSCAGRPYLKSVEFRALADSTQLDYSRTCDLVTGQLGDQPYRYTTGR